jgi:lipopolysaccharide transport system permease protein
MNKTFAGYLTPLLRYRGFILESVAREYQLRVSGSALGAWWMLLGPLAQVVMYALILSELMKTRLPGVQDKHAYVIYLLAGMAFWALFSEVLSRSTNIFIENAGLLKKLSFPRITLPVIVALSAALNHLLFLTVTILFLAATGHFPGWEIFALLPLGLLSVIAASALGITLGVLNVFYRDVGQLLVIFIQFWFWATPIVYTQDILPESIRALSNLNPLIPLVDGYHQVILLHRAPDWAGLITLAILTLGLIVLAQTIFRRAQGELVDAL